VRQDPPSFKSAGGLIIPWTVRFGGRYVSKGTVISAGTGEGKKAWYGMPKKGERILFAAVAELPDTSKRQQDMFKLDEDAKVFMIHAIDLLGHWDPSDGEPVVE
jgi:hypothetical protein